MTLPEVTDWREDILGPDFQALDIRLGPDPEGEGEAVATLVRYLPQDAAVPDDWASRSAVLWVPGMTDYFFQAHVAEQLHAAGHAFYALDLRKMGRARQPGQHWHYADDFRHYYPDLTAALTLVTATHPTMVPLAHSTGGLIVAMWANHLARNNRALHAKVAGIILNSPWLDMMYPRPIVALGRPVINALGRLAPHLEIPGGNLGSYGVSIHRDHHGHWDFNTEYKPVGGHRKYLGWLRQVVLNQKLVHSDAINVQVPVLTLCSATSRLNRPYSEKANTADTVLDVEQIQRWAPHLGEDVTVHPVAGARHDLFLSTPEPLAEALDVTERWLAQL